MDEKSSVEGASHAEGNLTIDTTITTVGGSTVNTEDVASPFRNEDGATTTTPTSSSLPATPTVAQHKFQAGDHVIRWEMLPIAWPIQIHGIVLSVNETTVVLVDFGLAAAPSEGGPTTTRGNRSTTTTTTGGPSSPTTTATVAAATSPSVLPNTQETKEPGGVEETKEEPEDDDDEDQMDADTVTTTTTTTATTTPEEPIPPKARSSWFSSDPKEMETARKEWMEKSANNSKKIMASFQKLHPTKKQRLNVIVLDDPSEWNKWKKVNYDRGLFGFGSGDDDAKAGGANDNDNEDNDGAASPSGKSKWWTSMSLTKKPSSDGTEDHVTVKDGVDGTKSKWWQRTTTTTTEPSSESEMQAEMITDTASSLSDSGPTATIATATTNDSSSPSAQSWWKKRTTATVATTSTSVDANPDDGTSITEDPNRFTDDPVVATSSTTDETGASWSAAPEETPVQPTRAMNPAMAKLMNQKKQDAEQEASSNKLSGLLFKNRLFGAKKSTTDAQPENETPDASNPTTTATPKKLDLPTADPPKLVLARTRWLLQNGEAVLPPYHAFHANSECIAVFCKTGYWRNIQADVFLHSTAIGNAKTMGVATMGVAASVPLLAPVIAGLGVGMVAAPWLILSSAKKQAIDITQKMTDLFWAQAEAEVFVECIEHWSKIDEYYKQQQLQQDSTTTTTTKPDEESNETNNGDDGTFENSNNSPMETVDEEQHLEEVTAKIVSL